MRMRARCVGCGGLATLLVAAPVIADPPRPPIADPAFGFFVEGRVLRADGRPAAGVAVERATSASYVGETRTTDAAGHFVFEARGLGWGPGTRWRLTIHRTGCRDVVREITLRNGPIQGRARDEATGVVLRLPWCPADRARTP